MFTICQSACSNMASFDSNYSTFSSPLHGNGVKALSDIPSGNVVFQEKPLHFLQTLPNRQVVLACGECAKFIGSNKVQMEILKRTLTRQDLSTQQGSNECIVGCSGACGEFYCSETCRETHWNAHGHSILCTGRLTDEEAETSPLFAYKMHACTTNEIFLMVADLFAAIVVKADKLIAEGAPKEDALTSSTADLNIYVRELWWDAAIVPAKQKPNAFKNTLKTLVTDAWSMLDDTLMLTEKGYHTVLSAEYMSRTIGMFEQNNVGVRLQTPLAAKAMSMTENSEDLAEFLEDTKKIVEALDGADPCCDEDDGEDEEEGDDEDEDGSDGSGGENEDNDDKVSDLPPIQELQEIVENEGLDSLFPPLDGTAFYTLICQINHSCVPNVVVKYTMSEERGLLAELHAIRDIAPGEEFVQSYIDQSMTYKKRAKALADYGFQCTCVNCATQE